MRFFLLFIFYFTVSIIVGQSYNPLVKPNTYQSKSNPNYWKNKLPTPGYWQQDVHYKIKANIDEKADIITGKEELTYWNNSPDTLYFVFFHLYQNAFQPNSYYHNLQVENNKTPQYGGYETSNLGTVIESIKVNDISLKTEEDNTLLKVYLEQPLLPNSKITFHINFETFFDRGTVRRRMAKYKVFGQKHYNGVHWYPRISVYDRKFGWTTDQHLGKEFYGDFGTFDVELTFASNYIVGATGNLVNRNEVLPQELRKKLDVRNFKDKPWNSPPSIIIPYKEDERKTWVYHAENVHDFAFTADPNYRIGEAEWNNIKCYSLVLEPHASRWQNAAEYAAKVIKIYSTDFGEYTYHKMIVADANDGMEYPMLTLDGGEDPTYRGLLAHEIGHNWFYGQVGTNETYRAALDEGFTQFLTAWALIKIDGDTLPAKPIKNKYRNKFTKPTLSKDARVYLKYLKDANTTEGAILNTHSNDFNSALGHGGGYRQVYYKTATMLYNLQYVLGDELFLKAMQHYYNKWKIAHPYTNDFRNAIINYTKVDLNWFFDQWFNTNKTIDYAIKKIKPTNNKNEYVITFKRIGKMQMPIDFTVTSRNDSVYNFHIPNTWFVKKSNATVLPKWYGWDKIEPEYQAKVVIPSGIKKIQIDNTNRLADVNMLNNSNKLPKSLTFDAQIYNEPDWRSYEMFGRPELWYNAYDGIKTGVHINGDYMDNFKKFDATFWINTSLGQDKSLSNLNEHDDISFRINYETPIYKIAKKSKINANITWLDGLKKYQFGFNKLTSNKKTNFYTFFKSIIRTYTTSTNYLLYPNEWQINKLNNTINIGLNHRYKYAHGKGKININLKSSTLLSDYDYAQLSLETKNTTNLTYFIKFRSRFFALYGTGTNLPSESSLYLSGTNPEGLFENKFTRSKAFIPYEWVSSYGKNTNHFQQGGGLNLRGYAGYLAPEINKNDSLVFTYKGASGTAVNFELDFITWTPKFLKQRITFNTYLFSDAGIISHKNQTNFFDLNNIRADAGLGGTLTINKWGVLDKAKPLTLRFDMPFLLNRPPAGTEFIEMRWVVGVNRAF